MYTEKIRPTFFNYPFLALILCDNIITEVSMYMYWIEPFYVFFICDIKYTKSNYWLEHNWKKKIFKNT